MTISYEELKNKIPEMNALLFTHPNIPDKVASEVWIKFTKYGYYIYINLEQPFPIKINVEKLVGSGNALNCSDYKKDNELVQYKEKAQVLRILGLSMNFNGNIIDTVQRTIHLFEDVKGRFLYHK